MSGYLESLTLRLAAGLAEVPPEIRAPHAEYLRKAQRADGGFGGRDGPSDLYYTGFALRGLALCGQLHGEIAQRAAGFLQSRQSGQAPIVDFFSLIYSGRLLELTAGVDPFAKAATHWRDGVSEALQSFRREDGGYAKGPDGRRSSTYHTFLVLLCMELIERPVPEPVRIADFLISQRREDGGFVEIAPAQRSGTNPTAAAIASLKLLEALQESIVQDAARFLGGMQTDEGGLRANTRIPIADLLSTFTGYLTLVELDAAYAIDAGSAARYVESLQHNSGGYRGAAWDEGRDVEYTFYGLGSLALLRS